VQQVLADQQHTPAEIVDKQGNIVKPAPKPEKLPVPTVNQAKAEAWSSTPEIVTNFHGVNGTFDTSDGSQFTGRRYVALMPRITSGFTQFHGKGALPDIVETSLCDDRPDVTREDLGGTDPEQWDYGLDGGRRDPWQPHMTLPLISYDGAEIPYLFVARNKVSIIAIRGLIGLWRRHPRGKAGMLPIIEPKSGTYPHKTLKVDKPKPDLIVMDWVNADHTAVSAAQKHDEFNDDIPL
jgi:hypothetical protein